LAIENLKKHLILALFKFMTKFFFLAIGFWWKRGGRVDVNKNHDDNNGGGQKEKVKRVWQVWRWHCKFHPQLWIESRDMRSRKESNELFGGQEICQACMLQSEESRQNPSTSFWGRRKCLYAYMLSLLEVSKSI
jgi:hypothetical protein